MILNHTAPNVEPSILDGCEVPLRDFCICLYLQCIQLHTSQIFIVDTLVS